MSVSDKVEYYKIVKDILKSEEFQKRKTYKHHGDITVYDHSLAVSKLAYKWAKKLNRDYRAAAIGGLLHDFYFEPWQENQEKKPLLQKHGFVHAKEAVVNSYQYFPELMNKKIENIILRHMFPLNKIPPRYVESWLVTLADKQVSLEVIKEPTALFQFFGYKRKKHLEAK